MIIGPDDDTAAARESLLTILELLVDELFLKNNFELVGTRWGSRHGNLLLHSGTMV